MQVFSVQTSAKVEFVATDTCIHINVACIDTYLCLMEASKNKRTQLIALPCLICSIDSEIVSATSVLSSVASPTIHFPNATREPKKALPAIRQLQHLHKTTIKSYSICRTQPIRFRLCPQYIKQLNLRVWPNYMVEETNRRNSKKRT